MLSAFHVMTKPTGPLCNLDCTYCFYLEKSKLYPDASDWRMPDAVLETYIRDYIRSQPGPEVTFAWQGGEPTLLGVDYFRRVVELQVRYAEGKRVANALQTNGTRLNDDWGAFLAEHGFLVGVSIDGPEKIHDRFRVDRGHRPTFAKVMRGIEVLQRHRVDFNTLTVLHRHNAKRPVEIYAFLKEIGSTHLQFIPIVERQAQHAQDDALGLVLPESAAGAGLTPWSVLPEDYGQFLVTVFDTWVRQDVGKTYVQIFDVALAAYLGLPPGLCVFNETCGLGLALEHNGDLYSCDHYVYPEYLLGNIMTQSFEAMVHAPLQERFGQDKRDALPRYCLECDVRFACNGDCPKHRIATTPDGEPGLSHLCPAYKRFFKHIGPAMRFMANEIRQRRAPANIMRHLQQEALLAAGRREPLPNDACLCGSGRKFKKCCGRAG
ncbi:MAG: anaerobic sulfatase maturase [Candidatus Hydrogenedentes bacterium]|nr:anaerobic sulfatase maturase [Candidatus Hydrogenedentota bacterium]